MQLSQVVAEPTVLWRHLCSPVCAWEGTAGTDEGWMGISLFLHSQYLGQLGLPHNMVVLRSDSLYGGWLPSNKPSNRVMEASSLLKPGPWKQHRAIATIFCKSDQSPPCPDAWEEGLSKSLWSSFLGLQHDNSYAKPHQTTSYWNIWPCLYVLVCWPHDLNSQ